MAAPTKKTGTEVVLNKEYKVWAKMDVPAAFATAAPVKQPAKEPTLPKDWKPTVAKKVEAKKVELTAEQKKAAEEAKKKQEAAAKEAAKKAGTTTATTETKTEVKDGPGACVKDEECDKEVGGAKVTCGAAQLAAGVLSAIAVAAAL